MKKTILLQPVGILDRSILSNLKIDLTRYFKNHLESVEISNKLFFLDEFTYNSSEMKYNGREILNHLVKHFEKSEFSCILGLIDEDIKSLKRKYVFGMARRNDQSSLIEIGYFNQPAISLLSIYRLREKFYSRPENSSLLKRRILKIAIHELGHSLGLKKCKNKCIMECKRTISEIDEKTMEFCDECEKSLKYLFSHT